MSTTNKQPQRIDVLASKKVAFAQLSTEAAKIFEQHRNSPSTSLETLERAMEQAIDLIGSLEIQAHTPRHIHGDTVHYTDKKEIHAEEYIGQHTDYSTGQVIRNEITVEQQPNPMYKVSADLIVAASGNFIFRPQSKKLLTAAGAIDLTEQEACRLLSLLSFDFGL